MADEFNRLSQRYFCRISLPVCLYLPPGVRKCKPRLNIGTVQTT